MSKTYLELVKLEMFNERLEYLSMIAVIGDQTMGGSRWLAQKLYKSKDWLRVRNFVIHRDDACDLAFPNENIFGKLIVHHLNPLTRDDLERERYDSFFDTNNLVCCSERTHNAIHFGVVYDRVWKERKIGDTTLWPRQAAY